MKRRGKGVLPALALLAAAVLLSGCFRITIMPSASSEIPVTAVPATPSPAAASPGEAATPSFAQSTASPAETPAPSPTPQGPSMYSSYADLVSFDPASGIAQFDYFDMLKGEKAAAYLVKHNGYTEAEAKAIVDDYSESEFVKKNTNTQLRAIDLDDVSLSLMYQPSGEPVDDAQPVPSNAEDFRAIYALDPSLLMESYFYHIHVDSDGHVSLVEQVYWP